MYQQHRTAPAVSAYESQAARWKQGFTGPGQPGYAPGAGGRGGDLEGALVAELCSSVGSSSFPPRDVLQKLTRHLPSLDHNYVCELLDDKLQHALWQVQGKALSVLDAILKTADAETYKIYYHARTGMLQALVASRKDIVRTRAEKVLAVISAFVPPTPPTPQEVELPPQPQPQAVPMYQAQQGQFSYNYQQQAQHQQHAQPRAQAQHQQPPEIDLLQGFDDDDDDNGADGAEAPEPVAQSAFGFIGGVTPAALTPQDPAAPAPTPSAPPMTASSFGFLNAGAQSVAPAAPAPVATAAPTPVLTVHLSSASPPLHDRPLRVEDLSATRTLQQPAPADAIPTAVHAPSTSAFAFIGGGAPVAVPVQLPLARTVDVWDEVPVLTPMVGVPQPEEPEAAPAAEEPAPHDPIHDAFEGLAASTDSGLDSLDNTHVSLETPYPSAEPPVLTTEPLREVILDIELPPGPMGLVLDRTIADMAVIERFIPLPTGERGFLEMHPAICPGCALLSVNSVSVENKGPEDVGPVLAAFAQMPKVLRFKKLMNNGRTANPSTLLMPYIPPPPEEDEAAKKASAEHLERLTAFSASLDEVESTLEDIVRREQLGLAVADRKNQLAQLHGDVEKIQTQGIDSVILGPSPPPNFDEVKKFRSSLVRRADELTRRIQRTVEEAVPALPLAHTADVPGSPVSAFGFVNGGGAAPAPAAVASPVSEGSGFHFLNPSTPPVQTVAKSSFSFMDEPSEAPASSFVFLQSPAPTPATSAPLNSVFAGLSVREEPVPMNAQSAGPLTLSALGMSMASTVSSVSTLDASGLPASAPTPTPATSFVTPSASSLSTSSAFGFMTATAATSDYDESHAAPAVSSPTAFGFLRSTGSSTSSSSSSSESESTARTARGPAASAFAFISS
ncbi:hypothetical protein PybrP1_011495 [[Pythium] brassicae (nom. inval.)]|nr:hypothetical protein PybrP1_011495 [[Pythium] brassicae (nom. inval.)]